MTSEQPLIDVEYVDLSEEEELKALDKEIKDVVNDSAEFAKESPEPALDELWTDIYADELPQGSAEENA